jgi:hypothetical protein
MDNDRLRHLKNEAIVTAKRLIAITLYVWLILTLFALHRALITDDPNASWRFGFAFINALALAKVILIGQEMHLGERLKNKPLIYTIIFKSFLFSLLLFVFHILEDGFIGWWHGKGFFDSISFDAAPDHSSLVSAVILCSILFVSLAPFFAYLEIERAVGAETLRGLLFGTSAHDELAIQEPVSAPPETPEIGYWYFERAGTVLGPFTEKEIRGMLRKQEITGETLVYNQARGIEWSASSEVFAAMRGN